MFGSWSWLAFEEGRVSLQGIGRILPRHFGPHCTEYSHGSTESNQWFTASVTPPQGNLRDDRPFEKAYAGMVVSRKAMIVALECQAVSVGR